MPGSLALIFHAHLPFVRHPEHEHFLEEEWLFEAVTESYIPLLRMMQRLIDEKVAFKLTMSLTPTLCAMLQDNLLCERYVRHLDLLIDLAMRERQRNRTHPQLRELAQFYLAMFQDTQRFFVQEYKHDLLTAFRELNDSGQLEIIGSAATHGLLPLLDSEAAGSPEAARAQILIGRDVYRDLFTANPCGFWLPECAYWLGLETILKEAAGRFMRLAIRQRDPRLSRATAAQAFRFGAQRVVTLVTLLIVNSTEMQASTFRSNIWVPSVRVPESFPA